MSHLGRWLSALVDGELDPQERDRVLNHVAGCQGCLDEVNAMRALKRRLTALGETSTDDAITGRLIDLAHSDLAALPSAGLGPVRPGRARRREAGQAWRVTAGSAGSVIAVIGIAAFLLGNSAAAPPAPKVTPSVDSYLLQHAYDAGQEPAVSGSGSSLLVPDPATVGPGRVDPWRLGAAHSGPVLGPMAVSPTGPPQGNNPPGTAGRPRGDHLAHRKAS